MISPATIWRRTQAAIITAGVGAMACLFLSAHVAIAQESPDSSQAAEEPAKIDWMTDYDAAVAQAGTTDRHIIAEFSTDWCKWCKKMEDSTFSDPQVIALGKQFLFLRINAEVDTALANRFHVSGYPTVILLEKAGNEVDRILGFEPPAEFAETIKGFYEGKGTFWVLEKDNREKPNDPKTLYLMGKKQAERGDIENARLQFGRVIQLDKKNSSGYADDAQFQLAILQRKEQNWYKAVEAFRTVVNDYPESELTEDAQIYIGWLYAKAGDSQEAIKSYKKFLKDFSKSSETNWVKQQIQQLEQDSKDKS